MRSTTCGALLLMAGALLLPAAAQAARWQAVASERGERVDIDLGRLARAGEGQTVAWTRLVLGREVRDPDKGAYTAVEALNYYDCVGRRFTTVRRVYLGGERIVKEETVASPKAMPVAAGSVDDRLWTEACKLRTVGEMKKVAEAAQKALSRAPGGESEQPGVMHADMRTAGDSPRPRALTVSDAAAPAAAPAEKPADVLPPKRYIELPKIDKSQIEHPKGAAETAKAAEKPLAESSRQALERQYATSGPQRTVKKRRPARAPIDAVDAAILVHRNIHWSYEGEGGPANWGKLRPEYATCSTGKRQSPIDIRDGDGIRVDLEPIVFDYKPSLFRIVDTGNTVQVNFGDGNTLSVMGRQYGLVQMHFHRPSEERVNGRTFDMVLHLVHRDADGHLAVVALLIERGPENPLIQNLWNNLPLEVDQELAPSTPIDLQKLLPADRSYMTYMGSLTTPPCTEGVLWMVFRQPLQVSVEQIAIFSRLYRNNARPVQPLNNRLIKESR